MNPYMHISLSGYPTLIMSFLQNTLHTIQRLSTRFEKVPFSELIVQAEEATTVEQLNRVVNQIQEQLWELPPQEQTLLRSNLINTLTNHVLHATQMAIRIEAARWLRLLVQAGLVTRPADIFVTLVTATVRVPITGIGLSVKEQEHERHSYLKLLFECFWPFRHPYPAYAWEEFPANEIFYPLASLLAGGDLRTQEAIIAVLTELPTLDDREITDALLPLALRWARHSNPEYRRRITDVLARMSHAQAQEALQCLLTDPEPTVRFSAQRVSS
jgi:hypothetical protein